MNAVYQHGQFTGAVLIASHDKIIYEKAFGFADHQRQRPFTPDTLQCWLFTVLVAMDSLSPEGFPTASGITFGKLRSGLGGGGNDRMITVLISKYFLSFDRISPAHGQKDIHETDDAGRPQSAVREID